MTVISVQSHVASGHVGNAAAEYPLRRLGFDVACVHTTLLAHHPGHGAFCGTVVAPETVRAVLDGLAAHGVFAGCEALLSGYLGSAATGLAVADAWGAIRRANPQAFYCCQPVIGDADEGVYVAAELPVLFRDRLMPAAGAVIANAFEVGQLSVMDVLDPKSAKAAATAIRARGPAVVIVTSVPIPESGGAEIGNLLATEDGCWLIAVPKLEIAAKGTGDFLSAVWLGHFLSLRDPLAALREALTLTQSAVVLAHRTGAVELPVVETMALPAARTGELSPRPL
jgi:pyridoxine kinase